VNNTELDFSILDAIIKIKSATATQDAPETTPVYKTITNAKNAPQAATDAFTIMLPDDPLYNSCPWDEPAGQPLSEYEKRINKAFTQAYSFLIGNKHARTDGDWERIAGSLSQYTDPLTVDLIVAAVKELEREYKDAQI